jgi:hypothetical protein
LGGEALKRDRAYRVWYRDDESCARAVRAGEGVAVELSAYGANDFVLDFLVGSGLWSVMAAMRPDGLRKENGKPWRALNGVEILRELARVDRIAQCGKIVRDTRLMMIAGFNAEAVAKASGRGAAVVTPETLANHLGRISPASASKAFYDEVRLLRQRRWIRGTTYAADAHEIIVPYGRRSERMGKVGEAYGYKLVLLLNIAEERERAVGFVLAPLHHSERTLLRVILRHLAQRFGPVGRWMETLVLDRGYWGAEYLLNLRARHGVDVVTRAQHEELGIVRDIEGMLRLPDRPWQRWPETHSRLGKIEVRGVGIEGVMARNKQGREAGVLNAVVADEYDLKGGRLLDEQGRERPRVYYVTTLPTAQKPQRTRGFYRKRWVIENQGFRELTQQWALDRPAGRKFNALNSRIAFALMLYNAERVLRMKHPGDWRDERERLRARGEKGLMAGPSLACYTPQGHLGLFTPDAYERLIAQRERDRIARTLREGLAAGEPLERTLDRLGLSPLPPA